MIVTHWFRSLKDILSMQRSNLLASLIGVYTPLSTAALAQVDLEIDEWSRLGKEPKATLTKIWQPGELED